MNTKTIHCIQTINTHTMKDKTKKETLECNSDRLVITANYLITQSVIKVRLLLQGMTEPHWYDYKYLIVILCKKYL